MPIDNQYERDFENVAGKRFPGRYDPRELQNIPDAGDGNPGLQAQIRNWVKYYIHQGVLELALAMNGKNIDSANNVDINGILDVLGVTDLHDTLDMNNQDIEKVKNLDVDGDVDIEGDVDINGTSNLDDVDIDGTLDVAGVADFHDVIDMNSNKITALTNGAAATDAMAFGQKFTAANARAAINDIFGSDGKADSDIDFDGNDIDNIKNIDENVWFASTRAEIQAAIDGIGANAGWIILQSGTIDLSGTKIDVDQGGSYVIQGQGNNTIVDCGGDNPAFDITSCTSCVLRDFYIDATDISSDATKAITINESSDYPVLIDNVYVYMPTDDGIGIDYDSDNVIVQNCTVDRGEQGINGAGANCKITGNTIKNQLGETGDPGETVYGINNSGANCKITGNTVDTITGVDGVGEGDDGADAYGINNTGKSCIITDNIVDTITSGDVGGVTGGQGGSAYGIYNTGTNCTVGNNIVDNITGGTDSAPGGNGDAYGIAMDNGASGDSSITGNTVDNVNTGSGSGGTANGLDDLGTSDFNIWVANNARGQGEGINDGANSINQHNIV